jgi:hypothetical protein
MRKWLPSICVAVVSVSLGVLLSHGILTGDTKVTIITTITTIGFFGYIAAVQSVQREMLRLIGDKITDLVTESMQQSFLVDRKSRPPRD